MKLKRNKFTAEFVVRGTVGVFIGTVKGYSQVKVSLTLKFPGGDVSHSGVIDLEDPYGSFTRNAFLSAFCTVGNAKVNDFVFRHYDRVSGLRHRFTQFVVDELGP